VNESNVTWGQKLYIIISARTQKRERLKKVQNEKPVLGTELEPGTWKDDAET